jgi:hypothetical protein
MLFSRAPLEDPMKPLVFALFIVIAHLAVAGMAASRHLLP